MHASWNSLMDRRTAKATTRGCDKCLKNKQWDENMTSLLRRIIDGIPQLFFFLFALVSWKETSTKREDNPYQLHLLWPLYVFFAALAKCIFGLLDMMFLWSPRGDNDSDDYDSDEEEEGCEKCRKAMLLNGEGKFEKPKNEWLRIMKDTVIETEKRLQRAEDAHKEDRRKWEEEKVELVGKLQRAEDAHKEDRRKWEEEKVELVGKLSSAIESSELYRKLLLHASDYANDNNECDDFEYLGIIEYDEHGVECKRNNIEKEWVRMMKETLMEVERKLQRAEDAHQELAELYRKLFHESAGIF